MTLTPTNDAPPAAPPPKASRRLPPPCWTTDETAALIDCYRDKWYVLRRSNLRANHWQEVADAVAARCPPASCNPRKTAVQCRHKMEKLRKRYRTEFKRYSTLCRNTGPRYASSWIHFRSLDAMVRGEDEANRDDCDDDGDSDNRDEDEDDFEDLYPNGAKHHNQSPYASTGNGTGGGGGSGFRIRIPTTATKIQNHSDESPNFGYGSGRKTVDVDSDRKNVGDEMGRKKKMKREEEPMAEMVSAIKLLGDGFVKMERMKMEMAREVEAMRTEMELKRTEMILESQQRIMEAFAKGISEKNNRPK